MSALRLFLIVSTLLIYAMTLIASFRFGFNWPAVALEDLRALNWRSQFDTDFIIYLLLGSAWIAWREGLTPKGYCFGFLSVVLGGMFTFPYLLLVIHRENGRVRNILLGVHAEEKATLSNNTGSGTNH